MARTEGPSRVRGLFADGYASQADITKIPDARSHDAAFANRCRKEALAVAEVGSTGKSEIPQAVPIGNYIADFVCHERHIVVEVDGGHHNQDHDRDRVRWLNDAGYSVLRFWNNDVLQNPMGVLEAIVAAISEGRR